MWLKIVATFVCLLPIAVFCSADESVWAVPLSVHLAMADDHPDQITIPVTIPSSGKLVNLQLKKTNGLLEDNIETPNNKVNPERAWTHTGTDGTQLHSFYHGVDQLSAFRIRGHGENVKLDGIFRYEGHLHEISHRQKRDTHMVSQGCSLGGADNMTCQGDNTTGFILSGVNYTCADMSARSCYDDDIEERCCEMCQSHSNSNQMDCKYGDKEEFCTTSTISANFCYSNDAQCCGSCATLLVPGLPEDCRYGDESPACSNGDAKDICGTPNNDAICCGLCAPPTTSTTSCLTSDIEPIDSIYSLVYQPCNCSSNSSGTICQQSLILPAFVSDIFQEVINYKSAQPALIRKFVLSLNISIPIDGNRTCIDDSGTGRKSDAYAVYERRICVSVVRALSGVAVCQVLSLDCRELVVEVAISIDLSISNKSTTGANIEHQLRMGTLTGRSLIAFNTVSVRQKDDCKATTNRCSPFAKCIDLPETYYCECYAGYRDNYTTNGSSFPGAVCTEICTSKTCAGEGMCEETAGQKASCNYFDPTGARSGNVPNPDKPASSTLSLKIALSLSGVGNGLVILYFTCVHVRDLRKTNGNSQLKAGRSQSEKRGSINVAMVEVDIGYVFPETNSTKPAPQVAAKLP